MNNPEKEFSILEKIHNSKNLIRQRDLAKIAGLSLGMTNAILKRLVEKGFITIQKVNNRNIRYAVSPLGIEEISRKSFKFFKRTIKNIVVYKEAIEEILEEAERSGYRKIILIGKSDIDFIIEHICMKKGIPFLREDLISGDGEKSLFYIISENIQPEKEEYNLSDNRRYLKKILMG